MLGILGDRSRRGADSDKNGVAQYLGLSDSTLIKWVRKQGPDFEFFEGHASPPLSGKVELYLGWYPDFDASGFETKMKGRFGKFDVTWYKKTSNGLIRQETVIPLDEHLKALISIEAKRQTNIDKLAAEVARMPRFSPK
ncbi:MAG: hypothetical protein H0X34_11875 [Chthoniobacterales bacterium]|nr:hypothetical protein [Chthoniobacterales bacterium]